MADYLQGGAWTADDHARHPSFDGGLMAAIEQMRPTWGAVLAFDVGGGPGRYLESLARLGAVCIVIEPEPMERADVVGQVFISLTEGGGVDAWGRPIAWGELAGAGMVVLCLEVMEHIPRDQHAVAFDNLCTLVAEGGILVWSAATPGQGGQGHVAERSQMEWTDELGERGLMLDMEESARLRRAATLPWFRSNVMVWRRP